jgi:hypothetical protein
MGLPHTGALRAEQRDEWIFNNNLNSGVGARRGGFEVTCSMRGSKEARVLRCLSRLLLHTCQTAHIMKNVIPRWRCIHTSSSSSEHTPRAHRTHTYIYIYIQHRHSCGANERRFISSSSTLLILLARCVSRWALVVAERASWDRD